MRDEDPERIAARGRRARLSATCTDYARERRLVSTTRGPRFDSGQVHQMKLNGIEYREVSREVFVDIDDERHVAFTFESLCGN